MSPTVRRLLVGRGVRAGVDGYVAVLLPAYLLELGYGTWDVGVISTATLLGSALATLALGAWGHRLRTTALLPAAALLMIATGLGFAGLTQFWPLLLVAFFGTVNPGSGDVSVFLPLEQARLAAAADGRDHTRVFARYSLVGTLCAAAGALAAGVPDLLAMAGIDRLTALRAMFGLYACAGLVALSLYTGLPVPVHAEVSGTSRPLGPSRSTVVRLAALFSVDSFAGGLVVNSLLALWLYQRFGLSLAAAGTFFFWTGLMSAFSQLAAPRVARRFGLLNTMVFTHIPSSLFLIAAALAPGIEAALGLLLLRAALSQMDVPVRTAYVMAVVTPAERSAAASFTAVPRSLAAALGPTLGGGLFAAGWLAAPLVAAGVLKIAYDVSLLATFRHRQVSQD